MFSIPTRRPRRALTLLYVVLANSNFHFEPIVLCGEGILNDFIRIITHTHGLRFGIICLKIPISRSTTILLYVTFAKTQPISSYSFYVVNFYTRLIFIFYKNHISSVQGRIFMKFIFLESHRVLSEYVKISIW